MSEDLLKLAKNIILKNLYLTLATAGRDNKPWATPLFYCYDDKFNFYWVSPKLSLHSQNIKSNPNVSVVVFDSQSPKYTGIGLYMTGEAFELDNQTEIEKGLKLEFERLEEEIPNFEKYLGENTYRVYKFVIKKLSITNDVKDEKGNTVDHRAEINLQDIIELHD